MKSIRARLLVALIILVALISLLAAAVTYRRVLNETSALFDYQLRQMALSLRGQISLAPRIEVPPDQSDSDFVVQIWDIFGARTYLSRPGLPIINQTVLGYANLSVQGESWRAYGLQTADGVIQIAQPVRVREGLARAAAERVVIPLLLLLPIMIAAVAWIVRRGLLPLRYVTAEVQRRDVHTLRPLGADNLPLEIEPLVGELNRLLGRLKEAFAAQRDFISDAAHELRSPLTALRLQLQLLERAPDETARLEARDRLAAAVERAIHLAEQLLTLARSDPQELAGDFGPVDLADVAAEGITDTHDLALARRIDLSLDASPDILVRGDREALRIAGAKPGRQRGALHATRTEPYRFAAVAQRRAHSRSHRHGARYRCGGSRAGVRSLLSARHGAGKRHRPRPCDRQGHRRAPRCRTFALDDAPGGGLHVAVSFPQGS